MQLTVNGDLRTCDEGQTVETLLISIGLDPRKVAVERNREIVPKSTFASTLLTEGDVIEIVHFIGGG